jgi:hypothetical protein
MSLQIEINNSNTKPELILEPKRKYMPLRKLDLQMAELIKDEWHHAIITYFNLKPKFLGQFADFPLNSTDIQNIKKYYGISPPQTNNQIEEHLYISEKKIKETQKHITTTSLDILDFYSQGYNSNASSILECDEDPFIYNFYYSKRDSSLNTNIINNNITWLEDYF